MARTRDALAFLFATSFLLSAPCRAAATRELTLSGTAESASGTRPATLRVLCNPDPDGGAISLELHVPEAYTRKDFDYDDFEGPDAPAASAERTELTVTTADAKHALRRDAAGWYAGDDPDAFVFGVSEPSRRGGDTAKLLARIAGPRAEILWTQSAFDETRRKIRAKFTLDGSAASRFADAARPCLTAAAR